MSFVLRAYVLVLTCCSVVVARGAEWSVLPAAFDTPVETTWEEDGDVAIGPRWTAWAGAIFLDRSNPRNQSLVSNGGATLLNANDMHFGPATGVDLNALRHGEFFDVDFRYFQVDNMSAHRQLFPSGGSQFDFATPYAPGNFAQLDAYYNTSIQSVELNARKNINPRLTVLAGFRYLALDDDLSHKFEILGDGLYNLHVDGINRMYGAQIGLDAVVVSYGRFQLESAVKAGVYGNQARNALRLSIFDLPTATIGRRASNTAFVGDWNFSGVFQITEHWALRGGYQLLWVSGVALSSEQYPVAFPNPIPGLNVVTTGDLFLHGALVSIQANW